LVLVKHLEEEFTLGVVEDIRVFILGVVVKDEAFKS
jgi:hypothetical protein